MVHFEELRDTLMDAYLWCCQNEIEKDREIVIRPYFSCFLGHQEEDYEWEYITHFEWNDKLFGAFWRNNFEKALSKYATFNDGRYSFVVGFHVFVRYDIDADGNKCCWGFDSER